MENGALFDTYALRNGLAAWNDATTGYDVTGFKFHPMRSG
jgi:hypothetical protein